jgi:hypothetical protein
MTKKEETVEVCGHINRHSYGTDGKFDNLSCVLEKGHLGEHSAPHVEERITHMREKSGKITGEIRTKETVNAYWGDMAGTPVNQIPVPKEIKPPLMAELEFGAEGARKLGL